jgi:hypothetical protein
LAKTVWAFPIFLALLYPGGALGKREPGGCEKYEHVRPNLLLEEDTHIHGRLTDEKDKPLKDFRVEIRKYVSEKKQILFKAATSDENGVYDLGRIFAGQYRMLPSPTRAFKQPGKLECHGDECDLDIVLHASEGEEAESACPVK